MKKILVYGMTDNRGGIESYVINVYRHIDKSKVIFDFIVDCPSMANYDEVKSLGSKVYFIPSRRENLFKHMYEFRKIVKQNRYKIVYYNILSASAALSVAAVCGLYDVKTVVHSHNGSVKNIGRHYKLRPFLNLFTNYRLACSKDAAVFMFGKKHKNNTLIINNAIDIDKFLFDINKQKRIREKFGINNKFVIGHVGRMCEQKNSLFLIDIFSEVYKKYPNSVLLYVGEGELRPIVEEKIRLLNLSNNVILTGMRDDVPDLLMAMDLFLLPSHFEGLPISLVEAQASGLTCVASKNVIPKEVNITGLVNFVSLEESPKNWANIIMSLNHKVRAETKNKITETGFNIKVEAKKLENYFVNL